MASSTSLQVVKIRPKTPIMFWVEGVWVPMYKCVILSVKIQHWLHFHINIPILIVHCVCCVCSVDNLCHVSTSRWNKRVPEQSCPAIFWRSSCRPLPQLAPRLSLFCAPRPALASSTTFWGSSQTIWRGGKVSKQEFRRPHHQKNLTSINSEIDRLVDGNVLIARELSNALLTKIS